jgi:Na+/H+ antiporter NhaC
MDFKGQKLAEQLCLYIILAAGLVAFATGWYQGSFAAMMKARSRPRSDLAGAG